MSTRKFEEKRAAFGRDILVLNGTDGSSTDAGEAIIYDSSANNFTLLLNGIDSNSTNIDVDIALNGTDSSSTDAGDSILLEDETAANDEDVAITSFPFNQPEHGGFVLLEQTETNQGDITVNVIKESSTGAGVMIENASITGTDNKIINGNFAVNQRAASFTTTYTAATSIVNNDDTYHFDRWYTLSDGNDIIDIASFGRTMGSRSFSHNLNLLPNNSGFATGLDVETANKKFGIAQIVESVNCNDLRGQKCTLSFKARVSDTTKLDNVKAAVVGWFGTSDTVTSDIISAWGDEGTNPTLLGSAEYQNEPSNLSVTTQWATYKVHTTIAAGAKNVIVFIWSDVTDTTAGDFLYLTDVQLERGEFENPRFQNEDYDTTLRKCQRHLPTLTADTDDKAMGLVGMNYSTTVGLLSYVFPVTPRTKPTGITVSGATHFALTLANNTRQESTGLTFTSGFPNGAMLSCSVAANLVAGEATTLWSADAGASILFTGVEL